MAKTDADDIFDAADADAIFDAAPGDTKAPAPSTPVAPEEGSQSEAALSGFGQGASFGFSDELEGVVGGGVAKLAKAGRDLLKTGPGRALWRRYLGVSDSVPDSMVDAITNNAADASSTEVLGKPLDQAGYDASRDAARQRQKQGQQQFPVTYGASNVVGGLMTPGPKAKGLKVAGATLKPWVGRALVGAGTGAVAGLGMSEGETAGDVAKDAGLGAGAGAVIAPVVGAGFDKLGGGFSKWLEERSRANALRAVGLSPGISDKARQLGYSKVGDLLELGARARDETGLIPAFSKPGDVAARVEPLLEESVAAKTGALEELDKLASQQGRGFDFGALAGSSNQLKPPQGWDSFSQEQARKGLEALGRASSETGNFSFADQVRANMGKNINWKAPSMGLAVPAETGFQRKAYGVMSDELLKQAQDVEARSLLNQGITPHPEDLGIANQIAASNKRTSALMDINALSQAAGTRDAAKGVMSLGGMMTGGGAATAAAALTHDPMVAGGVGAFAALANRFVAPRMPSLMTHVQHGAAQALPKVAGAYSAVEPEAIKTLTGPAAQTATQNAYRALMERFGVAPQSEEEMADVAFLKGQGGR